MKTFISLGLVLLVAVTGCGGGSSGSGETATGGGLGATPAASTLDSTITALERAGRLPALDRTSSLAGTDADGNGVRDDIDAYIAASDYTPIQKKALLQEARALQKSLLIDISDVSAMQLLGNEVMAAVNCMGDVLPSSARRGLDLEAMTMNTRERVERYLKYNAALSGGVFRLPRGDTCVP